MSRYDALGAVGRTLQGVLTRELAESPDFVSSPVLISHASPKSLPATPTQSTISLWLYRVDRNPDFVNQPRARAADDLLRRQPVPVDLHYLVTVAATTEALEQRILGRVIQLLHDRAVIRGGMLDPGLTDEPRELRVDLENLSLDDLSRIWSALSAAYRLSVGYQVRVVFIESGDEPIRSAPVLTKDTEYGQTTGVA
jgi:Pvc16 N-terminal domain